MKIADKISHLTFLFHYPIKIGEIHKEKVNSIRQYHLLRLLKETEALDVKTISKRLGQAQNTSSEMVWRMVEKGLLSSEKDIKDRRRTIVKLTEKGEKELLRQEKEIDKAFEQFCKLFLNKEERNAFNECSEKLFNIAKKVIKNLEGK